MCLRNALKYKNVLLIKYVENKNVNAVEIAIVNIANNTLIDVKPKTMKRSSDNNADAPIAATSFFERASLNLSAERYDLNLTVTSIAAA